MPLWMALLWLGVGGGLCYCRSYPPTSLEQWWYLVCYGLLSILWMAGLIFFAMICVKDLYEKLRKHRVRQIKL